LDRFDFAALILTPDDIITSRGDTSDSPRDNVLLELGLFIGRLGRQRTFIVCNRDKNLKLPSDLAGVTMAEYGDRKDNNLQAALSPACTKIRYAIRGLGTFTQAQLSAAGANSASLLRPIVTARVTTNSAGNVSTTFDLLVHNSGNSPAKNVRLSVEKAELEGAFSEAIHSSWRENILRCFSVQGVIPVLENGQSKTNSFGAISVEPESSTWKLDAVINVRVSYQDLDGNEYSHVMPLKIADDAGFAGSFWANKDEPAKKTASESEAAKRNSVRTLLAQEIAYNVKSLRGIYELVKAEQQKHEETFKNDGSGGWSSEGDPYKALRSFQPATLSRKAWESQIDQAPSVLSQQELESVFSFYGRLSGVANSQEQFLNNKDYLSAGTYMNEVLEKVEAALSDVPQLS
jgi:hypothetical protein